MSFGIIVKSRKRMLKHHKGFIDKCSKLSQAGYTGTDKRQKENMEDYKQVARESGLKFRDEMPKDLRR